MKVTLILPDEAEVMSVTISGFAFFRCGASAVKDGTVLDMTKKEQEHD